MRRAPRNRWSILHAAPQLSLVGLDLFKQRFEVLFALSGVPGLVFDAGELLGNPIDYLTDVVVLALDLVSCRLSCLGGDPVWVRCRNLAWNSLLFGNR